MKRVAAPLALLLAMTPARAPAQVVVEMTPERVREAIQAGTEKEYKSYQIGGGISQVWAMYTTPFSRVAVAATEAKRRYKTLTEADITPEMVAPELEIYAPAFGTRDGRVVNVHAIVIRPDGGGVIQPLREAPIEENFSNAFGRTKTGRSLRAWFPLSAVSASNEVLIVLDIGEKKGRFKPDKVR